MIVTGLNNLTLYKTMSPNMEIAIEYLERINMQSMEDGKYSVKGDDIYCMVSTYFTRDHDVSKYEIHRNYIDIQCIISGEELVFCSDASRMEADGAYDAEKDKMNLKDQQGEVSILLKPGMAGVFYPNDAHKPCCKIGDDLKQVRKLVIKVKF